MTMRVYGRVYNEDGTYTWQEVTTDANGFNDEVYATAFVQACKLNLGESPFFADYGIPARQSVQTQVPPDVYMARLQQRYAQYFASLIVTRIVNVLTSLKQAPVPTYQASILTHQGSILTQVIPV